MPQKTAEVQSMTETVVSNLVKKPPVFKLDIILPVLAEFKYCINEGSQITAVMSATIKVDMHNKKMFLRLFSFGVIK